jgi:hypothetical protein
LNFSEEKKKEKIKENNRRRIQNNGEIVKAIDHSIQTTNKV